MSRRWALAIAAGVLGGLTAAAANSPPGPGQALGLARELAAESRAQLRAEEQTGFYGRAVLGYALVQAALQGDLPAHLAAQQVDDLLRQLRAPASLALFGGGAPSSVAYRAHLVLLQEGRLRLAPADAAVLALQSAQLQALAADVQKAPAHLLPSYGERTFPADNEVLWAALALGSERTGETSLAEATAQVGRALRALEASGLPPSELIPGSLRGRAGPRGCAVAWTVAMRGLHDPGSARALYDRARPILWTRVGPFAAFREWPPGHGGEADLDSGPVLAGAGASATGWAAVAARSAQRWGDARALRATTHAGWPLLTALAPGQQLAARAIALWASDAGAWTHLAQPVLSGR